MDTPPPPKKKKKEKKGMGTAVYRLKFVFQYLECQAARQNII